MAHTLVCNYLHVVFSTKEREDAIPVDALPRLFDYVASYAKSLGVTKMTVGGMPNHIHIVANFPANQCVANVVRQLKTSTSKWLKTTFRECAEFSWQQGYGTFSVSYERLPQVRRYIENQQKHHAASSFDDEMRHFYRATEQDFDMKYLLD